MASILALAVSALFHASLLFMVSSGLTFIFGIIGVLNLAHGAIYMIGAYVAFTVMGSVFGSSWKTLPLALMAGILIAAVIGALIERGFFEREYERPIDYELLLTFGLLLVFQDVAKMVWGAGSRSIASIPGESFVVLGTTIYEYQILTLVLAAIVAIFLWGFLNRTTTGLQMGAISYDREVSGTLGINVSRLLMLAFMIGSALAGLAGALASPLFAASTGTALEMVVLSFAVIVIGGMGSISGALLGSVIIGFARSAVVMITPQWEIVTVYAIMVAVLLIRPVGIFGVRRVERR